MTERRFQEVPDKDVGNFFKFDNPGDACEGTLVAIREEDSQYGKQKVYDFRTDNGDDFIVGGCYDIDEKLKNSPVGTYARITFRETRPNGPTKTVKKFKVEVAEGGPGPIPEKKKPRADIPF